MVRLPNNHDSVKKNVTIMDFNVEEEKKSPVIVERMHFLIVLLLQLSSFPEKKDNLEYLYGCRFIWI